MPQFSILLTGQKPGAFELQFAVNETPAGLLWFDCLKKAIKSSRLSETRLYDFPGPESSLEEMLQDFEKCIAGLALQFPEILNTRIDKSSHLSIQNSMNLLHRNFAHNHLIEKAVTAENQKDWHEFNSMIHRIESRIIELKFPGAADGIRRSRMEFYWEDPFAVAIPDECYPEFTLKKEFGDIQNIYTQVGRNILELYYAGDSDVPLEHVQPFRRFSANGNIHFGPPSGEALEQSTLKKIEAWFQKNSAKLNAAGVYWDNPNKALGAVNVARLLKRPESPLEMREFQKQIYNYNKVADVIDL